jgi:hypothetical protein
MRAGLLGSTASLERRSFAAERGGAATAGSCRGGGAVEVAVRGVTVADDTGEVAERPVEAESTPSNCSVSS